MTLDRPHDARLLPREERPLALGFAGVWLVFLLVAVAYAGAGLAAAGDAPGLVGLLGATALFVAVYLAAYLAPHPLSPRPRWVSTAAYTVALVAAALLLAIPAGTFALNTVPYVAAVWVFNQPRRIALAAGALIGAAGVAVGLAVLPPGERSGPLVGIGVAVVIMLVVRMTTDWEDSLTQTRHELALSHQREALARDVHDVVGHSLTAVHVKAQLVQRLVDVDPERARAEAQEIVALTRTALGEVRGTVDGLTAPELGPELARSRRALADGGVRLDAPSPDDVAALPAATAGLYAWVLREAVTNVLRHAHARHVRIEVSPDRLTVRDDGVGPTATADPLRPGNGVASMRARVERAGGHLTLTEAAPGHDRPGTLLEVAL